MDQVLIGVALGVSLTLLFLAGAGVNHALERRGFRNRVCSIVNADDHRAEAARLLSLSLKTFDPPYEKYLRNEAFYHFQQADLLENGPYKIDFEASHR